MTPEDFGFNRAPLSQIQVHSVEESVAMVRGVLENQASPARDIVALNAGTAIYAADLSDNLADGITQAQSVLSNGAAREKLAEWVKLSQSF
ncbi:Glycosyl transferase, family 3 domain protein [Candidatus Thiomargarita nelsonii]|uniref:Glycosyl transferase, family 3 domain protein n=1 Tax=Candidatus Thiomargarita nelsonii TaxID=1003181 RepID=A0A176S777_9GAMM|nr:Glycosyl transferase, family 3 domain protein [Candidatus Thiomargarita nelsonii]